MTARSSTGFVASILGPTSFDTLFKYGCIEVYSGSQPASADAAATGTLLARITADGGTWAAGSSANGLLWSRSGRYAFANADQTWKLTGLASGIAGWFRVLANATDHAGYSASLPRLDGAVGIEGASTDLQLILPTTTMAAGTVVEVSQFTYAIPPLGA